MSMPGCICVCMSEPQATGERSPPHLSTPPFSTSKQRTKSSSFGPLSLTLALKPLQRAPCKRGIPFLLLCSRPRRILLPCPPLTKHISLFLLLLVVFSYLLSFSIFQAVKEIITADSCSSRPRAPSCTLCLPSLIVEDKRATEREKSKSVESRKEKKNKKPHPKHLLDPFRLGFEEVSVLIKI